MASSSSSRCLFNVRAVSCLFTIYIYLSSFHSDSIPVYTFSLVGILYPQRDWHGKNVTKELSFVTLLVVLLFIFISFFYFVCRISFHISYAVLSDERKKIVFSFGRYKHFRCLFVWVTVESSRRQKFMDSIEVLI